MNKFQKRLWIGLVVMAVLTPLGIYLPEKLGAGGAWGEWAPESLKSALGYLPAGLSRLAGLWEAPVKDYGGACASSTHSRALWYVASALIVVALAAGTSVALKRFLRKREHGRK